jgi:hypothetical protein
MTRTSLTESRQMIIVEAIDVESGLFELQIITPGQGSSGFYPTEVLEAAVNSGVWSRGTQMFIDHPTMSERSERPERSVRDLAGALVEDARWENGAVVAKARVYGPYRPLLAEAAGDIGISIRASGQTEANPRKGARSGSPTITSIDECFSVDFVTKAGRGGAILQVLEAQGVPVAEASANDTREALGTAVTDTYRIPETQWAYVRDYDPDAQLVWFDLSGTQSGTYQQGFELASDSTATLTGTSVEVAVRTTYVPVTPAGQSTTTESQGGTMPQIEEARLSQLEADAGRVPVLESERTAAIERAETAERQLAESTARTAARPIVAEVFTGHHLPATTYTRVAEALVAAAPLNTAGQLDESALRAAATTARTAAEAEIAEALTAAGAGSVRGFGASTTTDGELTEAAYDDRSARTFGRQTVKGA